MSFDDLFALKQSILELVFKNEEMCYAIICAGHIMSLSYYFYFFMVLYVEDNTFVKI